MKKLLFGIISLSMLTFAAQPTLTNNPAENTNIFQTGQSTKRKSIIRCTRIKICCICVNRR